MCDTVHDRTQPWAYGDVFWPKVLGSTIKTHLKSRFCLRAILKRKGGNVESEIGVPQYSSMLNVMTCSNETSPALCNCTRRLYVSSGVLPVQGRGHGNRLRAAGDILIIKQGRRMLPHAKHGVSLGPKAQHAERVRKYALAKAERLFAPRCANTANRHAAGTCVAYAYAFGVARVARFALCF